MKKFTKIEDLKAIVVERHAELYAIKDSYLNEAGHAAMEAYKAILWYLNFHDDIKSLKEDEDFMNLVSIPDKHPEYYKILRMLNRSLNA